MNIPFVPFFAITGLYLDNIICAPSVHYLCIICAIFAQTLHTYYIDDGQLKLRQYGTDKRRKWNRILGMWKREDVLKR